MFWQSGVPITAPIDEIFAYPGREGYAMALPPDPAPGFAGELLKRRPDSPRPFSRSRFVALSKALARLNATPDRGGKPSYIVAVESHHIKSDRRGRAFQNAVAAGNQLVVLLTVRPAPHDIDVRRARC